MAKLVLNVSAAAETVSPAEYRTGPNLISETVAAPAFAGITDNRPKPNADTATSAIRLIDVFVDICFLSLKVDLKDFFRSAWRRRTHSSDIRKSG
jgi:hypothetical protein